MLLKKILFASLVYSALAFSQNDHTMYSLTSEIGAGYSRYFTTLDYKDLNKNGFSGTLRIMWNPEHLLSVGLETGYQYLYSVDVSNYETDFGSTNFSASMYTVPIFIVFAMKITSNIKINGGSGMYLLYSQGEMFGDNLKSDQLSIGANVGISYVYPINNSVALGGELLYSYISKTQDQTFALQVLFVYKFLEW